MGAINLVLGLYVWVRQLRDSYCWWVGLDQWLTNVLGTRWGHRTDSLRLHSKVDSISCISRIRPQEISQLRLLVVRRRLYVSADDPLLWCYCHQVSRTCIQTTVRHASSWPCPGWRHLRRRVIRTSQTTSSENIPRIVTSHHNQSRHCKEIFRDGQRKSRHCIPVKIYGMV
jgi:hypothetical protein